MHSAQGSSIFEVADLAINLNRAPLAIVDGVETFPPIHGLIYTALSRFASVDLIRHWPQRVVGRGERKTYEDVAEGERKFHRMFQPDDVYCDPRVLAFYEAHAGRTPAWV